MKRIIASTLCLLLSSCATVTSQLPDINPSVLKSEQIAQEATGFVQMLQYRDHLSRIADPILAANADICSKTWQDIGVITHTLKSYPKELRPGAQRELSATTDPKVLYVRPNSPADKIGIVKGDILRDDKGEPFSAPGQKLSDILISDKSLSIDRDGKIATLLVSQETICAYPVRLKMTSTINAYATGKSIVMTSGMIDFVQSDAELALIIGHELAHNEKDHIRKSVQNIVLSLYGLRYTRPFEAEADYVGMYFAAKSGHDMSSVADIWRRLAKHSLTPIARAKTHPTYPYRAIMLEETWNEIKDKKMSGVPLIPNKKDTAQKDPS